MTTETLEIRQLARQFAETELRPHVERWDHDGAIDASVFAELAELGFFGMLVSEAHGGMGFDLPTYVAALEELAWGEPGVALTVAVSSQVAHLLEQYGAPEQKRELLEAMARGELTGCIAVAEEDGLPDAPATTAQRSAGGWRLDGTKKWVTNGRAAALALVTARAEQKISAFLVPTDANGYAVGGRAATLGFRPVEIVTVELKDVAVPDTALLASEASVSLAASPVAQLGIAALAVGIAQAALEHARGYADVREQFGQKLRAHEGIQFKLADMAMRTEAARLLLHKSAADAALVNALMAKVFASETAMWVTTQAVQIYGGYGYMRDYPVEKLMRDAKATEMLAGSNERLRGMIAERLYA